MRFPLHHYLRSCRAGTQTQLGPWMRTGKAIAEHSEGRKGEELFVVGVTWVGLPMMKE